jgi:hypothetical protein
MNVRVITVAMVMLLRDFWLYVFYLAFLVGCHLLLRDFGPYGIIFMTVFTTLDFPVFINGQFTSDSIKLKWSKGEEN